MNNPASTRTYKPPQALSPTPALYDELVGDGMENLAKATVAELFPIPPGSVILDAGCGTGPGTAAIISQAGNVRDLVIKGVDINDDALTIYRQKAVEHGWPAEAIKADVLKLDGIEDATFDYAIGTALLFTIPGDPVEAVRQIHRTLKPGGTAAFNSWAFVPNMGPLRTASLCTRPEGTSGPRVGFDKWASMEYLKGVLKQGGFRDGSIEVVQREVYGTTTELGRYVQMLWSFVGGTGESGWLESDEERWDDALSILKEELRKSDGAEVVSGEGEGEGETLRLRFVANIAVARK